jgi:hypothetical protein
LPAELGTDLEGFFRQLVRNLAATDAARLHQPLPLPEISESIMPYRANRRALQLESSEEYEIMLMRLCAGEGGFARTEPDDVRASFAAELRSTNPDLGILHLHRNAVIRLEPGPVSEALEPKAVPAFAPPSDDQPVELPPPAPHGESSALQCGRCGGIIPADRVVRFCPHCGGARSTPRCAACKSDIQAGWRHCVSCGAPIRQVLDSR